MRCFRRRRFLFNKSHLAQLVERRSEEPGVLSSNLRMGTTKPKMTNYFIFAAILEGMSYGFRDQQLENFVVNSTGCSVEQYNKEFLHAFNNGLVV